MVDIDPSKLKDYLKGMADEAERLLGSLSSGSALTDFFTDAQSAVNSNTVLTEFEKLTKNTELLGTAAGIATAQIIGVTDAMKAFVQAGKEPIGAASANVLTSDLNKVSSGISSIITKMKDIPGVKKLLPGLDELAKLTDTAGKGFANFSASVAHVQSLEGSLIKLRSQFGQFGSASDELGFINDLDKELYEFAAANTNIATSLGLATNELMPYAAELMKIPGSYKAMIDIPVLGSVTALEAAMRMARGTTGDTADSFDALTFQFRQFNTLSGSSLDSMSRMYSISQKLGVSFKDIKDPVLDVAKSFSVFGDNTKSSTTLVGNLASALQGVGLGIEPSIGIIKSVTGAVSGLNIAQKSFLSSQTGGAGGLRGAFQIDKLLQEGKLDEVYAKMEGALKKNFGGNIVSLEEGSQDDASAAQLTKQVAFLTEGPFGALVKSSAEAYKLLDAFAAGTSPTASQGTDNAAKDAINKDEAIQKRQENSLIGIMNQGKLTVEALHIQNYLTARKTFGNDNEAIEKLLSDAKAHAREAANNLTEGRTTGDSGGSGLNGDSIAQRAIDELEKTGKQAVTLGAAMVERFETAESKSTKALALESAKRAEMKKAATQTAAPQAPKPVAPTATSAATGVTLPGGTNSANTTHFTFDDIIVKIDNNGNITSTESVTAKPSPAQSAVTGGP